eukprot:tig00001362_g8352.t1
MQPAAGRVSCPHALCDLDGSEAEAAASAGGCRRSLAPRLRSLVSLFERSIRGKSLLLIGALSSCVLALVVGILVTVFPQSFYRLEERSFALVAEQLAAALAHDLEAQLRAAALLSHPAPGPRARARARPLPSRGCWRRGRGAAELLELLSADLALLYDAEGALVLSAARPACPSPTPSAPSPPLPAPQARPPLPPRTPPSRPARLSAGYVLLEDGDAGARAPGSARGGAGAAAAARVLAVASHPGLAQRAQACTAAFLLPHAPRASSTPPPPRRRPRARPRRRPPRHARRRHAGGGGGGAAGRRGAGAGRVCPGRGRWARRGGEGARMAAYFVVADVAGAPAFLLRADRPRDVVGVGLEEVRLAVLLVVLVSGAFFTSSFAFLEGIVLRPVQSLTSQVEGIAATDEVGRRVAAPRGNRRDEIGALAGAVNGMLAAIQRTRDAIHEARAEARRLLFSAVPAPLAERLAGGEALVAAERAHASVLVLKVSGYEAHLAGMEPASFTHCWSSLLGALDRLCARRGAAPFLVVGDTLFTALGLPARSAAHAAQALALAHDAVEARPARPARPPRRGRAEGGAGRRRPLRLPRLQRRRQGRRRHGPLTAGVLRRPRIRRYQFNTWAPPWPRRAASAPSPPRAASPPRAPPSTRPARGRGGGERGVVAGGGPRYALLQARGTPCEGLEGILGLGGGGDAASEEEALMRGASSPASPASASPSTSAPPAPPAPAPRSPPPPQQEASSSSPARTPGSGRGGAAGSVRRHYSRGELEFVGRKRGASAPAPPRRGARGAPGGDPDRPRSLLAAAFGAGRDPGPGPGPGAGEEPEAPGGLFARLLLQAGRGGAPGPGTPPPAPAVAWTGLGPVHEDAPAGEGDVLPFEGPE